VIRWFIILLETLVLIYILFENEKFNQLIQQFLNAIPSSIELKLWILKGAKIGTTFTIILLGIAITGLILYYLAPYVKTIFEKEALIEEWKKEFIEAKRAEIEKLKQEAQKKLQEVHQREKELRQQTTYYQHLSHQLKQKEVELELEFEDKRGKYLQELYSLQKKNKELQARIKKLKEQLKSCREKLKKRGLA